MDLMIVEDNPVDRMVIETRLRRAFPDAQISIADDLRQLAERLKNQNCDVVVTDYWLGWTDGLSVLQKVSERWPRTRVILLTGNGDEQIAAGALKLGLFRYLLKPEGFNELVPAVRLAYESRLQEDKQSLMEAIVDSIPQSVQCVDADGIVLVANRAAQRMYDYKEHQLVGREFELLIPAREREFWRQLHHAAILGEARKAVKAKHLRSNGTELAVMVSLIPLLDATGHVSGVVHIASPLEERRRVAAGPTALAAHR